MNRLIMWLVLLFNPGLRIAVQEAENKVSELERRLEAGEKIEDITVRILDEEPFWDFGAQNWSVEAPNLAPGRKVVFRVGRGGAKDDYAIVYDKTEQADGSFRYGVEFLPKDVVTEGTIGVFRYAED